MPFAAGPRHCIGETLALYEMLMHLYKVARRYRLSYVPDGPLELEAQINLRTRHPLAHEAGTPGESQTPRPSTELIEANRNVARSITYLEGENDTRAGVLRGALRAGARHPLSPAARSARAAATS